ncbi:hypothetical protein BDB00DRAFT_638589 [Zychaea mexicana]|uniref:uncharacterized protein n=1 Tax=Zychaea mexicana TaxID=64656 RepID=UPI0022FEE8CF|nr:uncharacterized protein BDB00DRAFT_638589 [Zychaea mexicana]KAI9489094.1 hypothetical protein BDB00DRAFT_638589 [Zychaea mexicana]
MVKWLQDAIRDICKRSANDCDRSLENDMRKGLLEVDNHIKKVQNEINEEISKLDRTKLNIESGNKQISDICRETRTELTRLVNDQIETLRGQNKQAFSELRDRFHGLSSAKYKNELRAEVAKDVGELVRKQFRPDDLEDIKTSVLQLIEQNHNLVQKQQQQQSSTEASPKDTQAKHAELVRSEIQKFANNKDELRKQLNGLDEWIMLGSKIKEMEGKISKNAASNNTMIAAAATAAASKVDMSVVQHLRNDLGQLNRKIDSIQKQLEHITDKASQPEQQQTHLAAVSRSVQDIARDLALTNSQLEMAESWYQVDEAQLARLGDSQQEQQQQRRKTANSDQDVADTDRQMKRRRLEASRDDGEADDVAAQNAELYDKIKTLEEKQTSLTEYLDGFRTTVLNPKFPTRLQEIMANIELILRSHEEFIAHLVDPVRAAQAVPIDLTSNSQVPRIISPAMMQAIQALVKDTADQTAKPLMERITALEAKLNQRN